MAVLLFTIILIVLTAFQIALIAGAPIGKFAWGGQHKVLPRNLRIGSIIAILIYIIIEIFVLSKAEVITTISHQPTLTIGMWVITIYLIFGTLLNAISRSKPERYVMTPTALVLAILALLITLQ